MNRVLCTLVVIWALAPTLLQAACNANIDETTPTARFIDNGDGTITDARTALMWVRCASGQSWNGSACTGTATKHTWQDALQLADTSSYAGLTNWRLPNVKELVSIVEQRCSNPAINETIFPATPTFYFWTGSPLAQGMGNWAHNVSFSDGSDSVDNKAYPDTFFYAHIRLVREAR